MVEPTVFLRSRFPYIHIYRFFLNVEKAKKVFPVDAHMCQIIQALITRRIYIMIYTVLVLSKLKK